jgi:hypothetical protein
MADPFDRHTVRIDWGDGTQPDLIDLTIGARALEDVEHLYPDDDPTQTTADMYTITVELSDGITQAATGEREITVADVDPAITAFTSTSPADMPSPEGAPVAATGAFSDVGVRDVHAANVDWGDGTVTPAFLSETSGVGSFTASHAYAAGGLYDVVVGLADDDLGGASAMTTAFITGIGLHDGVLQIVGDAEPNVITLNRESTRTLKVHADFLGDGRFRRYDLTSVQRIEIYACADDHVNIAGNIDDVEILILPCTGA